MDEHEVFDECDDYFNYYYSQYIGKKKLMQNPLSKDYLRNRLSYLGGPIQYQDGPNWRPAVKEVLSSKFGLIVQDPFIDEKQKKGPRLKAAIEAQDYDKATEITKGFVRRDLNCIQKSDLTIFNLPYKVPTYGTTEEIVTAWRNKIPVFIVVPEGKKFAPYWFLGYLDHRFIFGSWNELYEFLDKLNKGEFKNEWRFALLYDLI